MTIAHSDFEKNTRNIDQVPEQIEERLFEHIFQQAADALILLDHQGKIITVNPCFERLLGFSSIETIGKTISWLIPDQDLTGLVSQLWETLHRGSAWSGVLVIRRKDGALVNTDTSFFPIKDDRNHESYYAGILRVAEIRERTARQLAKQLAESQAMFMISQLLAGSIDLEVTLQQIADASSELIKTANRSIVHLLDEDGLFLQPVAISGEPAPRPEQPLNFTLGRGVAGIALQSGDTINIVDILSDDRYLQPSNEVPNQLNETFNTLQRSLLVAPLRTESRILGTLSVQSQMPGAFTSDDERLLTTLGAQAALAIEKARLLKDLQESLNHEQAARAQLVQAEKLAALGRIVASVAHELNNPIQAMQNALYLIQLEEDLSTQAKDDLQTVLSEADRMADLIARLREIYRPTTGEEFQLVSLNSLVIDVQKLIATHMRHNKVKFIEHLDSELPEIPMIRDQIKQVILNISLNAVEAMPNSGVLEIKTWRSNIGDGVYLSIMDNGPSIDPKILPYIFDPFVTTKDGGTGLGLAISYDIVQRHSGKIEVESEPGEGTIFNIWLPSEQTFAEHNDNLASSELW